MAHHPRHHRAPHHAWAPPRLKRPAAAHRPPPPPPLRSAWDNGPLRSLDTKQLLRATGTHISPIAHITERELGQLLHRTEAHNGFANRCLWVRVQRSQCLPEGGSLSEQELSALSRELRHALHWAAAASNICLTRNQ